VYPSYSKIIKVRVSQVTVRKKIVRHTGSTGTVLSHFARAASSLSLIFFNNKKIIDTTSFKYLFFPTALATPAGTISKSILLMTSVGSLNLKNVWKSPAAFFGSEISPPLGERLLEGPAGAAAFEVH